MTENEIEIGKIYRQGEADVQIISKHSGQAFVYFTGSKVYDYVPYTELRPKVTDATKAKTRSADRKAGVSLDMPPAAGAAGRPTET